MVDKVNLSLNYTGLIPVKGENFGNGFSSRVTTRLVDAGQLSIDLGGELSAIQQSPAASIVNDCPDPYPIGCGDVVGGLPSTSTQAIDFGRLAFRPTATVSYQMFRFLSLQGLVGVGPEVLSKRERVAGGIRPGTMVDEPSSVLPSTMRTTSTVQWLTAKVGASLALTLPHIDLTVGGGMVTGAGLVDGQSANNIPRFFVESGVSVNF